MLKFEVERLVRIVSIVVFSILVTVEAPSRVIVESLDFNVKFLARLDFDATLPEVREIDFPHLGVRVPFFIEASYFEFF